MTTLSPRRPRVLAIQKHHKHGSLLQVFDDSVARTHSAWHSTDTSFVLSQIRPVVYRYTVHTSLQEHFVLLCNTQMCATTQTSTVSGTVTTDPLLLHTHVCAVDHTQATFGVQGSRFWFGGSWAPAALKTGVFLAYAAIPADACFCHTRMCVFPQLHTNHKKTTADRDLSFSGSAQHTGGRACVQP